MADHLVLQRVLLLMELVGLDWAMLAACWG
jgi:hypothetical protein